MRPRAGRALARSPSPRRDADVDPVGACVGMKGSRVQAVVQELRGEKIDIVPFDRDPARFVIAAIQPAEVHKVIVDEADGRMELVVPDEKLSLAIGRKGQNVRLAAQLTGWKLDIISESKFKQMEEEAITALQQIDGVDRDHRQGDVPPRLPRARGGRRGQRSRSSRPSRARRRRGGRASIKEQRRARRWSASARSASRPRRSKTEPLTDRERLLFVRGVGERTVQLLEEAGYSSVEDVLREDEDKLAIRPASASRRRAPSSRAPQYFVDNEQKVLEAARAEAKKAAAPRRSDADGAEEPSRSEQRMTVESERRRRTGAVRRRSAERARRSQPADVRRLRRGATTPKHAGPARRSRPSGEVAVDLAGGRSGAARTCIASPRCVANGAAGGSRKSFQQAVKRDGRRARARPSSAAADRRIDGLLASAARSEQRRRRGAKPSGEALRERARRTSGGRRDATRGRVELGRSRTRSRKGGAVAWGTKAELGRVGAAGRKSQFWASRRSRWRRTRRP